MLKQILRLVILVSLTKLQFSQNIPQYSVILSDQQASSGYYFMHTYKLTPPSNFTSMITDRLGNLIYFKLYNLPNNDFKLQSNGEITQGQTTGNQSTARYLVMDSLFYTVDTVKCPNGIFTDLHDLQRLPNGNYLALGFEFRVMNLSSYNWFNGNGSPGSANANVQCAVVMELDENNNALFTWKAADHFQFGDVTEQWLSNPNNVDWTHSNSVALDNDGNILLCSRHFNEVTKINRQTGAIIWRLGGKRNQFAFSNDPYSGFWGQHDARRLANGNITIYDNGYNLNPIHPARSIEYSINEQSLTANLVWSYTYGANAYSRFLGSTQRLANGNTLTDWGKLIGGNSVFNVVKPGGNPVIEIKSADSMISYRSFNYTSLPFTLQRPLISCYSSSGNFYLEAPSGHSSYKWSTGAATRTIQITQPGTYYVFVPYGSPGGYISSERAVITNMTNPCEQVTGITHNNTEIPNSFMLYQNYPNPFNPSTKIKFDIPANTMSVKLVIYDAAGREVEILLNHELIAGSYTVDWNAAQYSSGIYYCRIEANGFTDIKKMVLLK